MPLRLSIDPGGEHLLPFAKKKLKELYASGLLNRYIEVESGERIFVQRGLVDHIRISASAGSVTVLALSNWAVPVSLARLGPSGIEYVPGDPPATFSIDRVRAFSDLTTGPQNDLAAAALPSPHGGVKVSGASWEYVGFVSIYSVSPETDTATVFMSDGNLGSCPLSHLLGELGRTQYPRSVVEEVIATGTPFRVQIAYALGDVADSLAVDLTVSGCNELLSGSPVEVNTGLVDRVYTKGSASASVSSPAIRFFLRGDTLFANATAVINPVATTVLDLMGRLSEFQTYLREATLGAVGGAYDIPLTESGEILVGTSIGLDGKTYYEYESFGTARIYSSVSNLMSNRGLSRTVPGAPPGRALADIGFFAIGYVLGPMAYVGDTGGPFTTSHRYYAPAVIGSTAEERRILYWDGASEDIRSWPTYRIGQNVVVKEPSSSAFTERVFSPAFTLEVDAPSGAGRAIVGTGTISRGTPGATSLGSGPYLAWSRDRVLDSDLAHSGFMMCTFRSLGFTSAVGLCCAFLPLWWDAEKARDLHDSTKSVLTVYAAFEAGLTDYVNGHPSDTEALVVLSDLRGFKARLDDDGQVMTRAALVDYVLLVGVAHTTYATRSGCDERLPLYLGPGDFIAIDRESYFYG